MNCESGRLDFGTVAVQSPPIRHVYMWAVIRFLAEGGLKPPIRVLEIGSWAGASAITWAKALKAHSAEGTVECVDSWTPYFDVTVQQGKKYKLMNDAAMDGSIIDLFKQNIRAAGVGDIVRYHRGTSREILPTLSDARFHIVYIDGSHVYEDVLFDLREARRLLADGGVLCGDDLELQLSEVDLADHRAALSKKNDVSIEPRSKAAYHPGVTQAVAELFPDVSAWEGFWAMRRMGSTWGKISLDISGISIPGHLRSLPVFTEEYNQYNIFTVGERVLAIRQQLGQIDLAWSEKELTEQYDRRDLFFVPSLADAESRIDMFQLKQAVQDLSGRLTESERVVQELSHLRQAHQQGPLLVSSHRGFNIVKSEGRIYGLRQTLGEINVTIGDAVLRERYCGDDLIISSGSDEILARIDTLELEGVVRELSGRLAESEGVVRELLSSLANSTLFRLLRRLRLVRVNNELSKYV